MYTSDPPADPARAQSNDDKPASAVKVSRRTVLTTAAAAGAAGAAGLLTHSLWPTSALGVEQHEPSEQHLNIWSVGFADGEYLALTGHIGHSMAVRRLNVGDDGLATIGAVRRTDLPADFTPTAICGFGDRILFAGSVQTEVDRIVVDNRIETVPLADRSLIHDHDEPDAIYEVSVLAERPALLEAVGWRTKELDLGEAGRIPWGVVSAVAAIDGVLVVSIEGSNYQNIAMADTVGIAVSTDAGASWTASVLASGQGEGFPTTLAATPDAIVAITVAGNGRRTLHQGSVSGRGPWRSSALDGASGPVLAIVADLSGSLDVFDGGDHGEHGAHQPIRVSRLRLSDGTLPPPSPVRPADWDVHTVLPVNGARGEWLAIGHQFAKIIG